MKRLRNPWEGVHSTCDPDKHHLVHCFADQVPFDPLRTVGEGGGEGVINVIRYLKLVTVVARRNHVNPLQSLVSEMAEWNG